LKSVLNDSLANFHISQAELEWTAIAYCHFLAPRYQWTNRFGDTYSFDDLSLELLTRPWSTSSCGAIHRLESLISILDADQVYPIISPTVRERLRTTLRLIVRHVCESQRSDGCWTPSWHTGLLVDQMRQHDSTTSFRDTLAECFITTGHMADWLSTIPRAFAADPVVSDRASEWLRDYLRRNTTPYWSAFCPMTHALHALYKPP
jgi:hypothetical protein